MGDFGFEFPKRSQLIIRVHNETLSLNRDVRLSVLNIDLAKRVIQHLTGVATGSNA